MGQGLHSGEVVGGPGVISRAAGILVHHPGARRLPQDHGEPSRAAPVVPPDATGRYSVIIISGNQ